MIVSDIKNSTLEAIAAIETTPQIVIHEREASFFKKYDPTFNKQYPILIKDFATSLKNIFGATPIDVGYVTPEPDNKAIKEPLELVLTKTWFSYSLLFYLFDVHKDAFLLKAGLSSKSVPNHINNDSLIVHEIKKHKNTIHVSSLKDDDHFIKEARLFNSDLFCPLFYKFCESPDEIDLIGCLAIGKNLHNRHDYREIITWNFISAALTIRLMDVVNYIKLEAIKLLKDHFECLGFDAFRYEEVIKQREALIKDINAYKNIKLNLKNLLTSLYGFKEAWRIFELFSQP